MWYERAKSLTSRLAGGDDGRRSNSVFTSLFVVVAGAVTNFALFVLIARVLSTEQFATFSIWFSVFSLFASIGVAGQGELIFKTWNENIQNRNIDRAFGALAFGSFVTLVGASLMAAVAAGTQFFVYTQTIGPTGAALFTLAFTLIYFLSPAARSISGILSGDFNMEVTWRLCTIVIIAVAVWNGMALSAEATLIVMAFGIVLAISLNGIAIYRAMPKLGRKVELTFNLADWRNRSLGIWAGDVVSNLGAHIDVIVIGLLVDPMLAGGYFVALKIANIFKRITAAFSSYASRRIAPLHYAGKHEQLRSNLVDLSTFALVLVMGGLLFLVVTATPLLALFGEEYTSEASILLILAVGAGVTTLAGPAPSLLIHTGHERHYLAIVSTGVVVRCLLLVSLAPLFGTVGIAATASIVSVLVAFLQNAACRRVVGLDPSIMSLLNVGTVYEK